MVQTNQNISVKLFSKQTTMKKIIVSLFCAIAFNCSAQTTQRLILVEEFTNARAAFLFGIL
ncbi:MAG TPA: hypothetical protein DCQ93_04745 [Bacteroidetes bacterium]|nr:hypothetical protein [Bacteroidota bacterium]